MKVIEASLMKEPDSMIAKFIEQLIGEKAADRLFAIWTEAHCLIEYGKQERLQAFPVEDCAYFLLCGLCVHYTPSTDEMCGFSGEGRLIHTYPCSVGMEYIRFEKHSIVLKVSLSTVIENEKVKNQLFTSLMAESYERNKFLLLPWREQFDALNKEGVSQCLSDTIVCRFLRIDRKTMQRERKKNIRKM
ncbi:MAG: hypothetical protein LBN29_13890 [Mediterranea sp.]|nr:hypothetical protein [Mediterranea sp.]